MKFFWDTSAVINSAISAKVQSRMDQDEHFARLHVLHEFFAIMTGRGIRYQDKEGKPVELVFEGKDAAAWLRTFANRISLVELSLDETLNALDQAQKKNVQGPKVYDYAHALAADKAGADILLTRNADDFKGLTKAQVVWP